MTHCDNKPCSDPAAYYYTTEEGVDFFLCESCRDAFELGQINAQAEIYSTMAGDIMEGLGEPDIPKGIEE